MLTRPSYINNLFALVVNDFIIAENVSEKKIFSLLTTFPPEFDNFSIEFWTGECWVTVC